MEFILELASAADGRLAQLEERVRRLEGQARQDSRTSSKPPSQDPPKTRQQRRAEARAKAKELLRGEREAGGQEGHRGAGRELTPEDQVDEIVSHYPEGCRGCGREFSEEEQRPGGRFGRHQVASCRRSACCWSSIARTGCAARSARPERPRRCRPGWLVGVRAQVAGGDRDVDRAEPGLAAGDRGARGRAVRRGCRSGAWIAICQHARRRWPTRMTAARLDPCSGRGACR